MVFVLRYPHKGNRLSAVGSHIAVFLTSPVVSSSRGPGLDRGPQFSLKSELSACWKWSKTLAGSDAPRPSGNNENIWSCYFPQFTSEWVVAGARLSLHPPEPSQEADRGRTAPQRVYHLCSQTKRMWIMFQKKMFSDDEVALSEVPWITMSQLMSCHFTFIFSHCKWGIRFKGRVSVRRSCLQALLEVHHWWDSNPSLLQKAAILPLSRHFVICNIPTWCHKQFTRGRWCMFH